MATEAYIPLPEEFKLRMREVLGNDAERLFEALDTDPDVAIRLNPRSPLRWLMVSLCRGVVMAAIWLNDHNLRSTL